MGAIRFKASREIPKDTLMAHKTLNFELFIKKRRINIKFNEEPNLIHKHYIEHI